MESQTIRAAIHRSLWNSGTSKVLLITQAGLNEYMLADYPRLIICSSMPPDRAEWEPFLRKQKVVIVVLAAPYSSVEAEELKQHLQNLIPVLQYDLPFEILIGALHDVLGRHPLREAVRTEEVIQPLLDREAFIGLQRVEIARGLAKNGAGKANGPLRYLPGRVPTADQDLGALRVQVRNLEKLLATARRKLQNAHWCIRMLAQTIQGLRQR